MCLEKEEYDKMFFVFLKLSGWCINKFLIFE